MENAVFNKDLYRIEGDGIELRLINTYEGKDGALPFYWWDIVLKSNNTPVGKISFRIGHNYHSYYNGNIGYEIDEAYRGNYYALSACRLALRAARSHNMKKIFITCESDNVPSYKTIEKLGASLIEEVRPPKDWIYYYEGIEKFRIYELRLDGEV